MEKKGSKFRSGKCVPARKLNSDISIDLRKFNSTSSFMTPYSKNKEEINRAGSIPFFKFVKYFVYQTKRTTKIMTTNQITLQIPQYVGEHFSMRPWQ
jgi:hypothetical protein